MQPKDVLSILELIFMHSTDTYPKVSWAWPHSITLPLLNNAMCLCHVVDDQCAYRQAPLTKGCFAAESQSVSKLSQFLLEILAPRPCLCSLPI